MSVYPKQKVSLAEKNEILEGEDFPHWKRENIDYFVEASLFGENYGITNRNSDDGTSNYYNNLNDDKWEILQLYRAAEGNIDRNLYKYVLNPYNTNKDELKKYPSQLRNYDIISPVIRLLMGEKSKRPSNYQVIVTNEDAKQIFKDKLNEQMMGQLAQEFVNQLNEQGMQTGVPSKEVPPLEQIKQEYSDNYNDNRAIFGQEALDYIHYDLELKDKLQDAFYDWLVSGRVFSYKEIYRDDLHYDVVPPLELRYPHSAGIGFIEDKDWCVRSTRWHVSKVIDRFRKEIKEEDIDWLEQELENASITSQASFNNENTNYTEGEIDVHHVAWISRKKVGIRIYQDDLGQVQEMEVDETYELNIEAGDIEIEWEWINEVRTGWKIGNVDSKSLYFGGDELPVQRDELNNSSKVKLPYNGRVGYTKNSGLNSVVKIGLNYQMLYNIYHYRFELTMARNKDKVMMMPMGLLPKEFGKDPITKFLYYMESTSVGFFDETKPNAAAVLSALKAIDMSLGKYAEEMIGLMRAIKEEWWDTLGLNRQRYGDVSASSGKGVTEQAVFRSAIITEEIFRRFDKFTEKELQGLLDFSKVAWLDGKKGMYINSDGRKAFLEINGTDHMESEYRVFVKDNTKENEKLQAIQQLVHPYAQKGTVKPHVLAEIIDGDNFSKVKSLLTEADKIEQRLEEAANKRAEENNLNIQHLKNENDGANRELDLFKIKMDYQKGVDVALINSDTSLINKQFDADKNLNGGITSDMQSQAATRLSERKQQFEEQKHNDDNRHKDLDRIMKQKEIDGRFKVAVENKSQ